MPGKDIHLVSTPLFLLVFYWAGSYVHKVVVITPPPNQKTMKKWTSGNLSRELLFSLSASHLWITFDHMLDPEVNDWQTLGAEVDPGIYDSFS